MSSTHLCEEELAGIDAGEGIEDEGRPLDEDEAAKSMNLWAPHLLQLSYQTGMYLLYRIL